MHKNQDLKSVNQGRRPTAGARFLNNKSSRHQLWILGCSGIPGGPFTGFDNALLLLY